MGDDPKARGRLTPLRAILRSAARSLGVERAAYLALITEMWAEVVGEECAQHSRPVALRGRMLLVDVESGVWAQELAARRAKCTADICRRLGAEAVEEIRVRARTGVVAARPVPYARPDRPRAALTPAERARIEEAAAEIQDTELREAAARAMAAQLRWRKRQS